MTTSDPFNKFLDEYKSTGRQKLNGYTLPRLDSLAGNEQQQAIDMLREEIIRNGMGMEGLVYINPEMALSTLLRRPCKTTAARINPRFSVECRCTKSPEKRYG